MHNKIVNLNGEYDRRYNMIIRDNYGWYENPAGELNARIATLHKWYTEQINKLEEEDYE